ncbi:hypothetical protein [Acinetobacter baumannii]|uniref:hypothetical protein n=1 Tax=Acinetobacter baumannii TaxID=470 RepID=UPI002870361C|nr:hypothetical protein [Acinetobacter baumannii]MDR9561545.1 hypothetical protein [Acinetobacter baumannii]
MLLEKIKNVQINLLEIVTVIFFTAIGYCLLYKYSFYNTLDIPWFITNVTPQFLFLTSLKLLFTSVIFCLIGYALGNLGNSIKRRNRILIVYLILFILFVCISEYYTNVKETTNFSIYSIRYSEIFYCFYMFSCALLFTLLYKILKNEQTLKEIYISRGVKRTNSTPIFFIILLGITLIIQPTFFGKREAQYIIENREIYLNKAKLKGINQNWYVIESMGDKFLLIDARNKIKIIEYKDIEYIQTINLLNPAD